MNTNSLPSFASVSSPSGRRLFRNFSLVVALGALTATVLAQAPADPNANGGGRRNRGGDNGNGNGNGGGRGNFDPAQMQEQMMSRLRERFAVTDDAEWALISERITKVADARRAAGGGLGGAAMMFGRGGPGGGGGGGDRGGGGNGGGGGRGGRGTGSPEMDSLRAALEDKLPDAEIKSRLTRVREARKDSEEKLQKAQEDLRSLLTVRQEAIAVMAGLLP